MKISPKVKTILKYVGVAAIASLITFFVTVMHFGGSEFMLRLLIKSYYIDDVDTKVLDEGAKMGIVASLDDEHSVYIDEEYGFSDFEESISGEYAGIGALIQQANKKAVIFEVYEGSPAEKSGLLPGDIIIESAGVPSAGSTLTEVSQRLKGKPGTTVSLKVDRDGKILEFELVREEISVHTVKFETLENGAGYIRISDFDIDTDAEFISALENLKDSKDLIIDLRDNPGGYMDVTLKMLDLFIDEGNLVTAKYKSSEEEYPATKENKTNLSDEFLKEIPIVVLVNGNSASASEIFSAALKDHNRATIVGEKTFGKGSIQTTFSFPGNSGVKLTVGHFYSPKGNVINKKGVKPDIEVSAAEEYKDVLISQVPKDKDLQLKAAIEAIK